VVLPDVFARPGDNISRRATALIFAISAGIGAGSAAVAPWLIPALFGEEFEASVGLLWLLIPGQVLFNTAWVISARHLGGGRARVAARAISLAAAVNLVAIVPAIEILGPEGAAVLTSACQALYLLVIWWDRQGRR
jgi:O-antigen/teichoic acid export membrane protein